MTDWFAGAVAEHYDEDTAGLPVEPVVDFLAPLGGGGALELAIGTGRIAVPLASRGVRVSGIDLSPDMVARLRAKSTDIPVVIGDMATHEYVEAHLAFLDKYFVAALGGALIVVIVGKVLGKRRLLAMAGASGTQAQQS